MSPVDDRLAAALRAEHAAVFAYGTIGARLDAASVDVAVQAELAHRTRRDTLVLRLAGTAASPAVAEPAYALPFPVTDRASALRLALTVEERTAAIWRVALPDTDGGDRQLALSALMDCAVRAVRLRQASGVTPSTVPFPGQPA